MLPLPARHERGEGWGEGLVSAARTFFGLPLSLALSPLLRRRERESFVCDGGSIELRPRRRSARHGRRRSIRFTLSLQRLHGIRLSPSSAAIWKADSLSLAETVRRSSAWRAECHAGQKPVRKLTFTP